MEKKYRSQVKKNIINILALVMFIYSCNHHDDQQKPKLLGNDFRLFINTPSWALAKAVKEGDVTSIKDLIAGGIDSNIPDSQFGGTLLMMAIRNELYNSTGALLENGADPNQHNKHSGSTAMHYAARIDDPKYLKILLTYKGNPNAIENQPLKVEQGVPETIRRQSQIMYLKV